MTQDSMLRRICLAFCTLLLQAFFSFGFVYGQNLSDTLATVHGKVMCGRESAMATTPLHGATVVLVCDIDGKRDTLYTVTNFSGEFTFSKIAPKPSFMSVSCVGFKTEEGEYDIVKGTNLCYFTLYEKQEQLDAAKVTAEIPLSKHVGDSTIYNAAAVQMMEGETLRDLLAKLPGFDVSENSIKVDGEEVKRTYVNGVLLFGDNAATAANTLKYSEVSQVKVFDEMTPEDQIRGLKSTRKQRVLDIITKEAMMSFSEAVLSASGGADGTGQARYTGIAAAAFYSEMMSFQAMGILDNTSQGLGIISGSSPSSALMRISDSGGQLSSYREDAVGGADFEKYWGSRDFGSNIIVHYKYRHDYGRNGTIRHENHFLQDGSDGRVSRDTLDASNSSGSHNVELEFTLRRNPAKSLYGHFGGSFDTGTNSSRDAGINMLGTNVITRDESIFSKQNGNSWFGSLYFKDISRPNLSLSSGLNINHSQTSTPFERLDTLVSSSVRMRIMSDGTGSKSSATLSTSAEWLPLNNESGTLRLGGSLSCSLDREASRQESFDMITGMPVMSLSETCDYSVDILHPEVTLSTQYTTPAIDMTAGFKTLVSVLDLHEVFPSALDEKKVYPTVVPSFSLKWKSLKMHLEGHQVLPSVLQIRKRISDRNTFSLVGGNPDIRPGYEIETAVDWGKSFGLLFLSASINQSVSWNAILSKMYYINEDTVLTDWDNYYAKAGSILYTYDNATSPATSTSATLRLSRLMAKRKIKFSAVFKGGFSNSPMYFGKDYVNLNSTQVSSSISLQWTPDKHWKATLSPDVTYQNSTGGDDSNLSRIMRYSLKSSVYARYGAFIGNVSYALAHNDNLSGWGVNLTRNILNASLGYSFFKKTLEIKAEGFDLLNAGSVYSMSLTPEAMTQIWTPTYGRRIMMTVTYHFRKSK